MDEYKLWKYTIAHGTARTLSLTYSAGKQYSLGKLPRANYDRQNQFINWALHAPLRRRVAGRTSTAPSSARTSPTG